MNQDTEEDVDMSKAVVDGFKEGITLLAHQVVGRTWMRERETGKKAGGILADDMGLGKTIQTLTRIVEGKPHKSDKEDGWSGTTLVVCPLSVVDQWKAEVEKMTKLRVVKHQGTSRTTGEFPSLKSATMPDIVARPCTAAKAPRCGDHLRHCQIRIRKLCTACKGRRAGEAQVEVQDCTRRVERLGRL